MNTSPAATNGLAVLHGPDVSVVVDLGHGVPTVLHWGAFVGECSADLRSALQVPLPHGGLDVVAPLSLLPEHGSGYLGRPGIEGRRRSGTGWAPRFELQSFSANAHAISTVSVDQHEMLEVRTKFELRPSGALRTRATLTNLGTEPYELDAFRLTLPIPAHARETLTFSGRWTNEFQPVRQSLVTGSVVVENRSGRTSHNRVPIGFAGVNGFQESTGEVWGVHLEWSGNSIIAFDVSTDGRRSVQAGELLQSGEVVLAPGESYTSPWVCAAFSSNGTNGATRSFHEEIRSRSSHSKTARPVTLNTWEAVYFDHDLTTLKALADRAASIGVERFIIDDGWFHGRRNDRAGLGDWWVDESVWPDGLWPLVDHVGSIGMEFGLWFEPEMVNPDSDLYRAHPEWVLTDQRYEPVLGRSQLVLDLAIAEVREYLLLKISSLLTEYPISYIKWDNNREYVHASHFGRASVHAQTIGLYRLLDDLRALHPNVEIESCASGGGRIDFAILERAARVWTSDCNDPKDRQRIQRGYSYVFPPEYMGAHIGGPISHTTRRRHSLGFRAGTAFFGHLGIEWNILDATDSDLKALTGVIETHKRFRPLLHSGRFVRLDHPNPAVLAHGVLASDLSEALFAFVQMDSSESLVVESLRIPGLSPDRDYRVEVLPLVDPVMGAAKRQPPWIVDGLMLTGRLLSVVGLQPPILDPESLLLIHVSER